MRRGEGLLDRESGRGSRRVFERTLMLFPIVIHKDEESVYGVSIPDLPGCFSAGYTFEEAIESAREAIACHLEGSAAGR